MDKKFNFVWEITEEGFKSIRCNEQSPDVFGALHFGRLLLEFRCAGGGYDDDYHPCISDLFIYGKHDVWYDWYVNGVPYTFYEGDDFIVPKRRTIEGFKKACEQGVIRFLNQHPELIEYAMSKTVYDEWY